MRRRQGVKTAEGQNGFALLHNSAGEKKDYMPKRVIFFFARPCYQLPGGEFFGVADGARTHDNRNHNPGLYQLSYSHHWFDTSVLIIFRSSCWTGGELYKLTRALANLIGRISKLFLLLRRR
jgi:hypothetical protein